MTRPTRRLPAALAVAVLALVALAGPASAHVTIAEREQTAGAYTALTFQVGHGCEGSPTTEIAIQVPEGVNDVTPGIVPGWDVEIEVEQLDDPVEGSHGDAVTEREAVVVYTGTLPDGFRQTFPIGLQVPADAEGTLYWPVVQTCEEGEHRWIQIPAEGEDGEELDEPAPSITVAAGSEDGHGPGGDDAEDADGSAVDAAVTDAVDDGGAADTTADAQATELASATTEGGSDFLSTIALVVGSLGLVVGLAGFATARRATAGR